MRELSFTPKDWHSRESFPSPPKTGTPGRAFLHPQRPAQDTPSLLSCHCSCHFRQDLFALCKLPQTQSTAFGLHGCPPAAEALCE